MYPLSLLYHPKSTPLYFQTNTENTALDLIRMRTAHLLMCNRQHCSNLVRLSTDRDLYKNKKFDAAGSVPLDWTDSKQTAAVATRANSPASLTLIETPEKSQWSSPSQSASWSGSWGTTKELRAPTLQYRCRSQAAADLFRR
jgi:hypothetical protein